jgi:hypothetical protein
MSTEFVSRRPLSLQQISEFRHRGVYVDSEKDGDSVILTDGVNYLWATETPEVLHGRIGKDGVFHIESPAEGHIVYTLCRKLSRKDH